MFAVIYRWKVKPGSEAKFIEAWEVRTREIREEFGTAGSRLHQADDGTWIAYAQWPSRQAWEAAQNGPPGDSEARRVMHQAVESSETLFRMDLVKDLLGPGNPRGESTGR
jgi:heme-degrading monooxygenase HmoA